MSERDDLIALVEGLHASGRPMRGYEARALVAGLRVQALLALESYAPASVKSALQAAIRHVGTQADFASAIGLSQGSISRMLNGKQEIDPQIAIAIETATQGLVSRGQLRPDLWPETAP